MLPKRNYWLMPGQLARLTGISAPALSLIETGKRDPRLTTLKRIADALRAPPADDRRRWLLHGWGQCSGAIWRL
ncbi:helix-turn-helix transcriptional regulator [Thalassobacter stenotrophicus]|uniref:helix-turn-helix domain-containing protein n=1 Tax=Thalassobacter stenotrophicus TaxID=266809 RepID=UPI0022A95582|nr:helix-turn-helix transcriptional regulator [Thalassobacter stenotrophicus]UYP67831.1 helix-turn-helix transcriptional regulator [Thalassobacter stenotrophicus]